MCHAKRKGAGGQERKAQSSLGRGLSLSRGAGKAWIVTSYPSAIGKSRILVQNPQLLASNLLLFIFLTFKALEIFSALSLSCPKKADTYMWTSEASFWVTWTRQHLLSTSYSTMKKHFHQSSQQRMPPGLPPNERPGLILSPDLGVLENCTWGGCWQLGVAATPLIPAPKR